MTLEVYDVYFTCEYVDYDTKESSIISDHEVVFSSNKIEAIEDILYHLWKWNNLAQYYGTYRIPMDMRCEKN